MKRLLARLELIEATGVLEVDVGWVNGNYQRILFHGWRLKTDSAEQPDPTQSDRLAELHRWLDARSRTIRLADLLIEVENDLGFSGHFQQPGEKQGDPGEVCALLAAILAHGCNLGLYTMEKVAPDIAAGHR